MPSTFTTMATRTPASSQARGHLYLGTVSYALEEDYGCCWVYILINTGNPSHDAAQGSALSYRMGDEEAQVGGKPQTSPVPPPWYNGNREVYRTVEAGAGGCRVNLTYAYRHTAVDVEVANLNRFSCNPEALDMQSRDIANDLMLRLP
jgi:hypothetical protein